MTSKPSNCDPCYDEESKGKSRSKKSREALPRYRALLEPEARLLFKIKTTQLKMMRARGFDISKEQFIFEQNWSEFQQTYNNFAQERKTSVRYILSQVYSKLEGVGAEEVETKVAVFYSDVPEDKTTLGKDEFCEFIAFLGQYRVLNGILITPKPLSPDAKKCRAKLMLYNIQVFQDIELTADCTEHKYVPKHTIISKEELDGLIARNKLDVDQLGPIWTTDAQIKYLGGTSGQVVKINRINFGHLSSKDDIGSMTRQFETYRIIRDMEMRPVDVEGEGDGEGAEGIEGAEGYGGIDLTFGGAAEAGFGGEAIASLAD